MLDARRRARFFKLGICPTPYAPDEEKNIRVSYLTDLFISEADAYEYEMVKKSEKELKGLKKGVDKQREKFVWS